MGFPRQENCSGLPFPSPGDHPNWGIKPMSIPALVSGFFTTEPPGKPSISVSVPHFRGWMNCWWVGGCHPASCCLLPWLFRTYRGRASGDHGKQFWGHHVLWVHVPGGLWLAGRPWLVEVRHPGPQWPSMTVWALPCKVRTEHHQRWGFCLTCTTSGAVGEPPCCTWSPSLFAFFILCFSSSCPQGPAGEHEWWEQTQMIQILRGHFPDTSGSKGEH